ncbi:MAG TPA: PspC domain-containing protein [Candidatus Methylomirabilis sp.]|nr:PspC domain-containing protein [Candidatus Methylomirabilis sp.]
MGTRITKSKTDRVIDGVCGGLAEHFGIDSLLVRLAFAICPDSTNGPCW